MASGNTLNTATAQSFVPPATLYATMDTRAGGSTPNESDPVADFDDSTIEYTDCYLEFPRNYAGGGVTLTLKWMATTATTGDVVWGAAFRRIADDAEDIDASHAYDYNDVTATTASATGEYKYTDITFTDGADMDSLAVGESFILRIRRNATSGSDTMTGDAELAAFSLRET